MNCNISHCAMSAIIGTVFLYGYDLFSEMGDSSGDSFIRLTTGDCRSDGIRFARNYIGPTLGILTSIPITCVTILHLPIDLLYVEEITYGRFYQR